MAQVNEMKNQAGSEAQEAPKKKNRSFLIILIVLVVVGGTFGITNYMHGLHHEETDDAQIDADISPVIPRISGYVTTVLVKDNQKVKKGDTLVILDNRSEMIQVEQAQAALESAKNNLSVSKATAISSRAGVSTYQANITTADAQIEAAKVTLQRATQDYDRYAILVKDQTVTQQQFEIAEAAKLSAERQLKVLEDQKAAASKQTNYANLQSNATQEQVSVANANIQSRQAELDNANLSLSYTVVVAPQDGHVSKINIQVGQFLQAGQALFSVVSDNNPWVVGNYKETQINKMHVGQDVTVHVDAYPGHDFQAKLTSFSPATGARFALLPPDNASGNFVKVVQRLPIKIEFVGDDKFVKELRPGMNVDVDVHLE